MPAEPRRQALLDVLDREVRQANAQAVLYGQAAAQRLGAGGSDFECLELVGLRGPVSAGELAAWTGLSPGAITGVLDRLENAGFVERTGDPKDRRRVLVRLRGDAAGRIAPLLAPMQQAMAPVYARYADRELELLIEFFRLGHRARTEAARRLREEPA